MGAIYNVPLGGALFALEVLLGTVALPLILPAMTAALIATAVSWITLPNQPTYTIPVYSFHLGRVALDPSLRTSGWGHVRFICAAHYLGGCP